jgi:hypothetical protein
VTAGTDGNDCGYTLLFHYFDLGIKYTFEKTDTAQVMGRFGAAVQKDTEVGDLFFQQFKKSPGLLRPGPGHCATGVKYRVCAVGNCRGAEQSRQSPSFIGQDAAVLRQWSPALFYQLAAHPPEHIRDPQSLRAVNIAQLAEAAGVDDRWFEGTVLVLLCQ